jgi:hypothetical protein
MSNRSYIYRIYNYDEIIIEKRIGECTQFEKQCPAMRQHKKQWCPPIDGMPINNNFHSVGTLIDCRQ